MAITDSIKHFWSAVMTGYKAFNESYVSSDQINLANFTDYQARKLRYSILWAMYENTAYDKIHSWAVSYKTQKGLYKYIRNIYNPSYRLGEFWKSKLLGGALDPLAGDGTKVPSALPINTTNEALRPAIAQVWKWSNWQVKKDVFGLWTPVLGDGVLKIVDDLARGKVYMKPVHPSALSDLELDEFGNVKAYVLEYQRDDPRKGRSGMVTYREIAERDGDAVVYSTYLESGLYAWDADKGAEWEESYGFIPMVVLQHNDVGLDFGWSELYPGLSKFREVDDQASKLNDQIRKLVEGAWLMAGVTKAKTTPTATGTEATDEKPQPGREEMKIFYATDSNAKAHSLVSPLDIAAVSANIKDHIAELERDYPELKVDMANASGDISGRALRINRAPAAAKVDQRRPNYDNAIVRAHQMAISIGGMRGYEAFKDFDLDSYADGKLDHSIGIRPVFGNDPMDKLEEGKEFWGNAKLAKEAGVPLVVYLKEAGWDEDKIKGLVDSEEYAMRLEATKNAVEGTRMAVGEGVVRAPRQNIDDNQDDNSNDNNDSSDDTNRGQ